VRGELAETPRLKIVVRDELENWRNVALVHVSALRHTDNFIPAAGEILVATPGVLGANFFAGQTVEISGVISRPPPPLAEGLFDFRDYLATRGIYYQLKTESTNDWKLLPPVFPNLPLTDRFLGWSKQTLALGLPAEDEPLRLLWAMTLGWRTAFTGDIGEPFLRAGTMHLFAIDGLRIALLSGMIVALLRALRLARAWCGAIAVPAIWFYTAATGWEPSAIRASVMMTIVLGGWALKRPGDLLNSLAAAAFVILLWNPRQLFEASFQLSFFVMLIIALMLPRLNAFFDRLLKQDALLPDELVSGGKKAFLWLARKLFRYCGLFSPGQPRLNARQPHRRAAWHLRAHGQPRRARLRPLAAVVHRTFQPRRLVFHGRDDLGQRGGRQNPRRVFLRPRTVVRHHRNLLRRRHRHFLRLVLDPAQDHFRRDHPAVYRRCLLLAMAVVAR
jgi:ComEC/Rec2-related protein